MLMLRAKKKGSTAPVQISFWYGVAFYLEGPRPEAMFVKTGVFGLNAGSLQNLR